MLSYNFEFHFFFVGNNHCLLPLKETLNLQSRILFKIKMYLLSIWVDYNIRDHFFFKGFCSGTEDLKYCCSKRMVTDTFCFVVLDKQKYCWYPLQRSQKLHTITWTFRLSKLARAYEALKTPWLSLNFERKISSTL